MKRKVQFIFDWLDKEEKRRRRSHRNATPAQIASSAADASLGFTSRR